MRRRGIAKKSKWGRDDEDVESGTKRGDDPRVRPPEKSRIARIYLRTRMGSDKLSQTDETID